MNIIFVSSLLPQSILDEAFKKNCNVYGVAQHLFNRSIVKGLQANNHQVTVLSYVDNQTITENFIVEDSVKYNFVRHSPQRARKNIEVIFGYYKHIVRLCSQGSVDAIICDVLNVSSCLGALFAARRTGTPIIGIVTDLMNMASHVEKSLKIRLAGFVNTNYLKRFDGYVLLTEYMNKEVNTYHRPYIVMEGICTPEERLPNSPKDGLFRIFYAGGRPSKDGLNYLIPAFKRIKDSKLRLDICGDMPGVNIGPDQHDSRITYHGRTVNSAVRELEFQSDLLVNPRPVGERYTYFSFPSKVMEYMSTGIPMLTTKLAGIPEEYYEYVYTINSNNEDCYYSALNSIINKPQTEIKFKGQQAREFVISKKDNKTQAYRIIQLINQIVDERDK